MNEVKSTEFSPLSITILKLQCYSNYFDISEIAFFEWLVVKARAFKFQEFYYSFRRITDEVHIKRVRLESIIKRFSDLGIIRVEIKGMPKQHHFIIDFDKIIDLIPKIYQFVETNKLYIEKYKVYEYFNELSAQNSIQLAQTNQQKEYNKELNKEPKREIKKGIELFPVDEKSTGGFENSPNTFLDSKKNVKPIYNSGIKNLMNELLAKRIEIHNEKVKEGRGLIKSAFRLEFSKNETTALYELLTQYETEEILNSFSFYVDSMLNEGLDNDKLLPDFLAKNPNTLAFDVVVRNFYWFKVKHG